MNRIITTLTKHYHAFPIDSESDIPGPKLEQWVKENSKTNGSNTPIAARPEKLQEFIGIVANLECFTYRAVNRYTDKTEYWNALVQPYEEFQTDDTVVYQTDTLYPTPDMIKAWCKQISNEDLQT